MQPCGVTSPETICIAADEKIIVFSTWTDMLDLIEEALMEASIGFQRLDGDVEPKDRGAVVADMRDDPDCRVFLVPAQSFQ